MKSRRARSLLLLGAIPLVTFAVALAALMALASSKPDVHVHRQPSKLVGAIAAAGAGAAAEFRGDGCTIVWIGRGSASWDNPANWSPARLPGPGDTACIPQGSTVVIKKDVTVDRFVNHGSLTIAGGTVKVRSGASG